jgi:hypothetical protein
MIDDPDPYTLRLECPQHAKKALRKASLRPSQGRVLHQNPTIPPSTSSLPQRTQRRGPTFLGPANAFNHQLKVVLLESLAEVAAVILDSIGGLIESSQKGYNAISVHGSFVTPIDGA